MDFGYLLIDPLGEAGRRAIPWRLLMIPILVAIGLAEISRFIPPVIWCWALCLLVVLGIWAPAKHRRLARKYQDRIDALDSASSNAGQTDHKD